jgi:hypothetical protein
MSTPIIGPLVRTNYLSYPPGVYDASADPNSSDFDPAFNAASPVAPVVVSPSPGVAQTGPNYGDAAIDMEGYHRPLERLHGTGLHAAGVAYGLQIIAKIGSPNVQILPGLALDESGRHIYLAATGTAEIDPEANVELGVSTIVSATGTPPFFTLYSAPQAEAPIDVSTLTGTYYVVVQWRETFDFAAYASDPNVYIYNDTPWLQFANTVADGQVVLGQVKFDGSGKVLSASAGDSNGIRVTVSLPARSLQLHRTLTTTAGGETTISGTQDGASPVPAAEVRSRATGGIEIAVANNSDQITVLSDAGGSFSTFAVGADLATVGDLANPGINLNGSEATVRVGAPGNYGDVLVYDGNNHLAVSLIGDTAHVIVGGKTLAGEVRMFNANASETMTLQGSTGAAVVQQLNAYPNGQSSTVDVNAQKVHIHGWDLCLDGRSQFDGTPNSRALVDGGNKLIVNYNGDYGNGVEIQSGLQVDDSLQVNDNLNVNNNLDIGGVFTAQGTPLMGNPARKAMSTLMFVGASDFSGPGTATQDVVLPSETHFTACMSAAYLQWYVSVSFNAAIAMDVFEVDGANTPVTGTGGITGTIFSPVFTSTGQTITFRAMAVDDSVAMSAYGIVYFE